MSADVSPMGDITSDLHSRLFATVNRGKLLDILEQVDDMRAGLLDALYGICRLLDDGKLDEGSEWFLHDRRRVILDALMSSDCLLISSREEHRSIRQREVTRHIAYDDYRAASTKLQDKVDLDDWYQQTQGDWPPSVPRRGENAGTDDRDG